MGNNVTFVVRDDFADQIATYNWDQIEYGIHDPSYSIRFIESSANDVDPIGNHANGISISHYEHTTGKSVLYIDSNMMFSAPLLYGLTAEELSEENIYLNAKRLSKFMFGPDNAFSVKQPNEPRGSANIISDPGYVSHDGSPKSFVFRYRTDNCDKISEDKDLLKSLSFYIKTGDKKHLSSHFDHITTLSKNESMLFSMHCPMPASQGPLPFLKFNSPLVKHDLITRLRIGVDKGVSANKLIASQAILEGMGYEIENTKEKTRFHETTL